MLSNSSPGICRKGCKGSGPPGPVDYFKDQDIAADGRLTSTTCDPFTVRYGIDFPIAQADDFRKAR